LDELLLAFTISHTPKPITPTPTRAIQASLGMEAIAPKNRTPRIAIPEISDLFLRFRAIGSDRPSESILAYCQYLQFELISQSL